MAFVSVEQKTFFSDILKTWVLLLNSNSELEWVAIRVDTPSTDIELKLPLIVLKRVSNDEWSLRRNNWYFWTKNSTSDKEKMLYGYTYTSTMQFDIMATTIWECNRIQWVLLSIITPEVMFSETKIPLKHFQWNIDSPTDLTMDFSFEKDVDWAILSTFDPNLHQHSISVTFDLDYLSETEVDKLKKISPNYII